MTTRTQATPTTTAAITAAVALVNAKTITHGGRCRDQDSSHTKSRAPQIIPVPVHAPLNAQARKAINGAIADRDLSHSRVTR